MQKQSRCSVSRDWLLLLICIISLTAFLLVTYYHNSFSLIDANVNIWAASIQSSAVTTVAVGISLMFDTTTLIAASLAIASYLFLKNYRAESLLLLGAMAGDALLVSLIKNTFNFTRPLNGIIPDTGFSYPSGHSAGVIVFVGVLIFFALQHLNSTKAKVSFGVVLAGLTLLVGFDRLYLNVHWFSDVLGGYLLGIFWLAFSIFVFYALRDAGKFQSQRFRSVARVLFILAFIVGVLLIAASLW